MRSTPTSLIVIFLTAGFLGCQPHASVEDSAPGPLERFSEDSPTLTTAVVQGSELTRGSPSASSSVDAPSPANDPVDSADFAPPVEFVPELAEQDGIGIRRLVTSTAIEAREPSDPSQVFAALDRVYAFIDVTNDTPDPVTLTVNFIGPSGQVRGGIELGVPATSPRWRTWAYTERAEELGPWRVEVRSEGGTLLGALAFEVGPGC